jgi:hypothetical protein
MHAGHDQPPSHSEAPPADTGRRVSPGRRRLPMWANVLIVVGFVGLLLYLHLRVAQVA